MSDITKIFNELTKLDDVYSRLDAKEPSSLTQDEVDAMYLIQKFAEALELHRSTIEKLANVVPTYPESFVPEQEPNLSMGVGMAIAGILTPVTEFHPFKDIGLEQQQMSEFQDMMQGIDVEAVCDVDFSNR